MQDNWIHIKRNGKEWSDRRDYREDNKYFDHKGYSTYTYWYAWRRTLKIKRITNELGGWREIGVWKLEKKGQVTMLKNKRKAKTLTVFN